MTTGTETTTAPELNGQAPGTDESDGGAAPQAATASERVMGVIGIMFAVGLLFIGLDLATGGAISRLLGAKDEPGAGG